ncbi:MAG TPA: NAD(+) kinase [Vicinamibacterales bacterium]|nr:NAD(+) kinase [Vicinamibacterales bacterium]
MPREFKTVGLWGRLSERSVTEPALQVLAHLRKRGLKVFAATEADGAGQFTDAIRVGEKDLATQVDLVVAIGGDGTLLHAARHVAARDVPLLGINRGRLGFLTDISPEHMLDAIDAILAGDYLAERRLMLAARTVDSTGDTLFALNDVVLQKGETGRLLDFTTMVDGVYVNTHRGDGLIVATPTGSTAYALSCGGPIIQPNVDALVMVPICPHTLSDRPLVLPTTSTVQVSLDHGSHGSAHVVYDGEALGRLAEGETLSIALAAETVTLLHPRDYNYYELLRSKLNWGRANRDRPDTRR